MSEPVIVQVESKPWWESKTIRTNAAILLLSLAVYVLHGVQTGQLALPWQIEPDTVAIWISIANLILRFVTTQPLTGGK